MNYNRISLSFVLLFILTPGLIAFLAWWILFDPLLLVMIRGVAGTLLELCFRNLGLKINILPDNSFHIFTNLLKEPEPYLSTLLISLDFKLLTLGLPIFWSFSFFYIRYRQFKALLIGAFISFLLINFAVFLKGIYLIKATIRQENVVNQYLQNAQLIVPVEAVTQLNVTSWLLVGNLMNHVAIFIFPIFWCIYSNAKFFRENQLHKVRDRFNG